MERPPIHLTIKWAQGLELMLNVYGATAADVAGHVAELVPLLADQLPGLRPAQAQQPTEEERPRRTEPVADHVTCPNENCSRYGEPLMRSRYTGLFCPGDDETEADGRCRWVYDHRGLRRKPTRAELDAAMAAAGGRR